MSSKASFQSSQTVCRKVEGLKNPRIAFLRPKIYLSFLDNKLFLYIVFFTFAGRLIGSPFGKGGVIASVLIIINLLVNSRYILLWFSCKSLLLYHAVCALSLVAYLFNERPFILIFTAISNLFFPSFFYVFGKSDAIYGDEYANEKKMMTFVFASVFIITSGLAVMIYAPTIYSGYFSGYQKITFSDWNFRYGSFIGSIQLGLLCSVCLVFLFKCKEQIGKNFKLVFMFALIGGSVISMQRGSWMLTAFALVACYIFVESNKGVAAQQKKIKNILVLIILFVALLSAISVIFRNLPAMTQRYWLHRFGGLSDFAFYRERLYQVDAALEAFWKYPFGVGLGAVGNKAFKYGLAVVGDNNYLTILVETGFFGLIAFTVLILGSVINLIKVHDRYLLIVIICMLVAGTGNSAFEAFPGTFIFWWVLGYSKYLRKKTVIP